MKLSFGGKTFFWVCMGIAVLLFVIAFIASGGIEWIMTK